MDVFLLDGERVSLNRDGQAFFREQMAKGSLTSDPLARMAAAARPSKPSKKSKEVLPMTTINGKIGVTFYLHFFECFST